MSAVTVLCLGSIHCVSCAVIGLSRFNLHLGTQHSFINMLLFTKSSFSVSQSFRNHADLLLKKHFSLLSMLKTVLLLNIFVETMIPLKHLYKI